MLLERAVAASRRRVWKFVAGGRRARYVSALTAVVALAAAGTAVAQAVAQTTPAQSYTAQCPASEQVTPALGINLIANPGAENGVALGGTDTPPANPHYPTAELPDCWTSSSPLASPQMTFESYPYSLGAVTTTDPDAGSYMFWGGFNLGSAVSTETADTGTQLISLGAIAADAPGEPYELSGWLGGVSTRPDSPTLTATFEDASGNALGTAQVGPVTPADRDDTGEMLQEQTSGTVPANTTQVLITLTMTQDTDASQNNAYADDLNFTIGTPAPPSPPPALQTWTGACPASEQVKPSLGINLISNPGAEHGTALGGTSTPPANPHYATAELPDCWTSSSPLASPQMTFESYPYSTGGFVNSDPNKGNYTFWGGYNLGAGISTETSDYGTQLIKLGAMDASGQPYQLSGWLGGAATRTDSATVTAQFEDSAGDYLGYGQIGPITPADRDDQDEFVQEQSTGTVPAGTTQVLVTLTMTQDTDASQNNAYADDLSLIIGTPLANQGPVLQTATPGSIYGTAAIFRPQGVAAANGTVYATGTANNVVAKVTNSAAEVIAGQEENSGATAQDGQADLATFSQPTGLAEDGKGDVFVADTGDDEVREITPDGTIRLFAGNGREGKGRTGGKATATELDNPMGVAVNAAGDVFIADTYNNRVLEVLPDGKIRDFAGTGAPGYSGDGGPATRARLTNPAGVAVDTEGDVYIADSGNNVIRRVDAKTGVITTVAGDYAADAAAGGVGGYSGDGGPATQAQLHDPQGIAVDGAGDLFIADTFNNCIREVTPDGTITTVVNDSGSSTSAPQAGAESPGALAVNSDLDGPYAVAVDDSTDILYIADTTNSTIAEVTGLAQSAPPPSPSPSPSASGQSPSPSPSVTGD